MIRQLNAGDIPAAILIAKQQTKVMGQDLTPEKRWHMEQMIHDYCSFEESPLKAFGFFTNEILTSIIFISYSTNVNAWAMVMLLSNSSSAKGGFDCLKLIKHAQDVGRQLSFYQYYTVVELTRESAYQDTFHKKVRSEFLYAIDEVVPARERPVIDVYWDWLFNNRTKELDVAVVHHWLPPQFRNKALSSHKSLTTSNGSEKQS